MEERITYFDIAKFIGLMMIILGHFGVPDINTFVYTFHIPMFFLISGYFFRPRENRWEFIKLKFRQLLIPYIIVMFGVIGINIIESLNHDISANDIIDKTTAYFWGYIYGSGYVNEILGHHIEIVGPIWFCLALFWDFVILNYLINYKYRLYLITGLFIIGYTTAPYIWLPFSIQAAMTSILFVYLGYMAKQYGIMNKKISVGQILPLLCLWGICMGYGGRFLIVSNYAVFVLTDVITALAASYLVILYSRWLEITAKSAKFMAFLGRYTIVMLCLHSIDVNIMPWNDFYKTPNNSGDVILIKILITFIKFLFPVFGAILVSKSLFLRKVFAIKA